MNVSDVMTRPVVSVRSDATVMEAGKLMMQSRISGLPVVDAEDHVVGIVTERDFLRLARPETGGRPRWLELITNSNKVDALTRLREERVDRIMTLNPITTSEEFVDRRCAGQDGEACDQAPAGHAGRAIGRDCQPLGSVARPDAQLAQGL